MSFQDSLFGRMSPEHSAVTEEKTSPPFSRNWLAARLVSPEVVGQTPVLLLGQQHRSLGDYLTANTLAFPNDGAESSLSQILEANVPEKYFLSPRACQGILNRAERRGKKLPEMLDRALRETAGK